MDGRGVTHVFFIYLEQRNENSSSSNLNFRILQQRLVELNWFHLFYNVLKLGSVRLNLEH